MPDISPAELIDLIVKRASELRRAGVLEVEVAGFRAKLAQHYDEPEKSDTPKDTSPDDEDLFSVKDRSRIPRLSHLVVLEDKAPK